MALLDPAHAAPVMHTLPLALKRRMRAALRTLGKDPTGLSTRLDVKRLDADAGQPMYRLRIGDWRVAFTVDEAVVVLRIFHRGERYGWLAEMS